MNARNFDRRSFLKAAGASGALLGASNLFAANASTPVASKKTKHVVLIAFAGGVRSRETFGAPGNVPTLKAMADDGVLYTRTKSSNLGHFGAALSLFTGIAEPRGIRENSRGPDPTIFEYVRKDAGLAANDVWISTSGGAQQTNFSYSYHADYGEKFGANTIDGDGLFNSDFKAIVKSFGAPRELDAKESAVLQHLRGSIETRDGAKALNSAESAALVERYILDELTRGTSDIRGANAADAKALRVARNLLAIFKPKLIAVVLQQADIAHNSFNGYVDIIRQNDAAIGELWKAVKDDKELRESTSFVILPEFGRDRDLNSRRGLDHGDGSEDLNYISTVCWGPDFKRGSVYTKDVQAIDACSTVCEFFGARPRLAKGKLLPSLFA